jgi:SOS-response transcriptional repressor LexA
MSITAHELYDHGAMAKHFKALARFLDRGDLRGSVPERKDWFELEEESEPEKAAKHIDISKSTPGGSKSEEIPFELVPEPDREHFQNCLPMFPDLPIAAGSWGDESGGFSQSLEGAEDWIAPPDGIKPQTGCFVARVTGKSMEPLIPSGSWCLFGPPPAGSRANKILIVWHASIDDPDGMGHYTLKRYESLKVVMPDDATDPWQHVGIKLHPKNPDYQPIELKLDEEGELRIVAEFLRVI